MSKVVRDEVERIVGLLTPATLYIRATMEEANERLENIDIQQPVALYRNNEEDIANSITIGSYTYKEEPLEVLFLLKEDSQDENLAESDLKIDSAEDLANEFYIRMIQSSILDPAAETPTYLLQKQPTFRIFDTLMVGVLLTMEVPIPLTEYICPS